MLIRFGSRVYSCFVVTFKSFVPKCLKIGGLIGASRRSIFLYYQYLLDSREIQQNPNDSVRIT